MEMFQKKDVAHLQAMEKIQAFMGSPEAMQKWMQEKREEFENI